jgi:hypothetical protein
VEWNIKVKDIGKIPAVEIVLLYLISIFGSHG